ncbi:MAG: glycosyltransferase [Isosphaeraceae bacterium]|nr:glycosyltransferase [Isosphaeraceae bacterium]
MTHSAATQPIASDSATPRADRWLGARSTAIASDADVLFHAPSHVFQAPGGGENQLIQTGIHLERLGLSVRLFSPWVDRLEKYRILHLFGMSVEGLELARVARARGLRVVVSPICWFEPSAIYALAANRVRGAIDAAKWSLKRLVPRMPTMRGALLALADAILPNSQAEADQLVQLFGVDRSRIRVVPNGVDPRFARAEGSLFERTFGDRPDLLYVGRIEPRKNVLALIKSSVALSCSLTVIGRVPPAAEAFGKACRDAAGPRVRFLPPMAHDDPLLASAYAAARVFALPSWFETPGLAALEAGVAGSSVVITSRGCTREYFGDDAIYVDPSDRRSIIEASARALEEGPRAGLAARLRTNYPWIEVARRTAEAYDDLTQ